MPGVAGQSAVHRASIEKGGRGVDTPGNECNSATVRCDRRLGGSQSRRIGQAGPAGSLAEEWGQGGYHWAMRKSSFELLGIEETFVKASLRMTIGTDGSVPTSRGRRV